MTSPTRDAVAIVGLSLRLPGSSDVETYWDNLVAGGDHVTRLGVEEAVARGAGAGSDFVPAYGVIDTPTSFDPERFGISATEALLTDPQQRLLLEAADRALAVANVDPGANPNVGVYAGVGHNDYRELVLAALAGRSGVDEARLELAGAADYSATRVSYRLGLTGASVNVQSACSTGLVATHLACRALRDRECDVALAGASSVRVPQPWGYLAQAGGIGSSDGVCRPFDLRASGAVPGDGVAVVVLKRLSDAVADGDEIWAVIRGSAVNNDGAKSGFAGVSATAQVALVTAALARAGLAPDDVSYVEAHGAATKLGDAVEWTALSRVFGRRDEPLPVGSVKGNVGHLREAAGMAGLVKATLCLRHGRLVPTANFAELPRDLARAEGIAPLTGSAPWGRTGGRPRRAGVSAFGLGGTNCHLVLEEAPSRPVRRDDRYGLLLISSHSSSTVDADTDALRRRVDADADAVGGIALSSRIGRRAHRYRRVVRLRPGEQTGAAFERAEARHAVGGAPVAFAFPGTGDHYGGMCAELRDRVPGFGDQLDEVLAAARTASGRDLAGQFTARRDPEPTQGVDLRAMLGQTRLGALEEATTSHLTLFCLQYALARTLGDLGIRPAALVGHSLGEWVAATLAGVFTLDDALSLVALRAELVEAAPSGGMLSVLAAADEVDRFVAPGTWLAAVNSPRNCVLSGDVTALTGVRDRMREAGHTTRLVPAAHPFHTPLLAPAVGRLRERLADVRLAPPATPVVSSVTGTWLGPEGQDPEYWASQLVRPVRFAEALSCVVERCRTIAQIGPGPVAPWLRHVDPAATCAQTVRRAYDRVSDVDFLLDGLAELWLSGVDVDWRALPGPRRLVALPEPALDRRVFDPRVTVTPAPAPGATADRARVGAGSGDPPFAEGTALGLLYGRLAELWTALLGVRVLRPDDHFFELGGDSLMGTHLIAVVIELTGRHVPARVVFADATLGGMAQTIHRWMASAGGGEAT